MSEEQVSRPHEVDPPVPDRDPDPVTETVDPDQIEVHWQHPRTALELPVLLVKPHPTRNRWAAVVENGVASVVCHKQLIEVETEDGSKIVSCAAEIGREETVPDHVAEALLAYEGTYGPVHTVTNDHDDQDDDTAGEADPNSDLGEF